MSEDSALSDATTSWAPIIDCIEALKVFDNCTSVVEVSGLCSPVPATCLPLPASYTVSCSVTTANCDLFSVTPHVPADGLANVTFLINFTILITVTDTTTATPVTHCTFDIPQTISRTVSLVAPTGFSMIYQCAVESFTCGPCTIANIGSAATPNYHVCCEVELCLEFQSKYPVKLLVWTSGYCAPTGCAAKQGPTLICPPTPLYPPQPS